MRKFLMTLVCGFYMTLGIHTLSAQPHYAGNQTAAPGFAVKPLHWLASYSEAVALSQSTSKPIAILFTGTGWCPACMKLEREVISNPEFAQAIGEKFVFLKAEFPDYSESSVIASPYKPLVDRYGIKEFPTIVVINANGQLLYTVRYRQGGPQAYTQEMLQKLQQTGNVNSMNRTR